MLKELSHPVFTITGLWVGRVYVIADADGLTLIDAGTRWSWRGILHAIKKAGRAPQEIRRIVITHAHPDHAGNLPALKRATGARIYAPEGDADVLEGKRPLESLHFGPKRRTPNWLPELYLPACRVDHRLEENDLIPAFGGLTALSAPGHTCGQMVYWQIENRVLFCGDVAIRFPHLRPPFAIFTQNVQENARSIQKISLLQPNALFPGHGRPILTCAADALDALRDHITRVLNE